MPDPNEVASIQTSGGTYSQWTYIEVSRVFGEPVSTMRFRAEEGSNSQGFPNIQLMPMDSAKGFLAGQQVINGNVSVRQASYDPTDHTVEIIVISYSQNAIANTVKARPGQYINQTAQQIFSAVCAPFGLNVTVAGVPGASLPFPRVSEQVGETCMAFMKRLARHRDLHAVDDVNGNLIWTRGSASQSGSVGGTLVEGGNIKSARIVLDNQWAVQQMIATGQQNGGTTTQAWAGAASQVEQSTTNPNYPAGYASRIVRELSDMPTNPADAQMLANHMMSLNALQQCEATITVPGWFAPSGALWIDLIAASVTINSPSLVAAAYNPFTLLLRGVKHMQDDKLGTRTELNLCIPNGMGSADQFGTQLPGAP